jgi:asparagine synthetase B (glutamine-hydrolysing)
MMFEEPGFFGAIGEIEPILREVPRPARSIWLDREAGVGLWATGMESRLACAWHSLEGVAPAVFVFGAPRLASDAIFGPETVVRHLDPGEVAERIQALYQELGTDGIARLDGDFALAIYDYAARRLVLAVDKFGCDDIFYRVGEWALLFGSHPAMLMSREVHFDPTVLAFFLAQEGFIPAPYTCGPEVKSVGRARYLVIDNRNRPPRFEPTRYWRSGASWRLGSRKAAVATLGSLLRETVLDGPDDRAAVLLSGGVDSSLVFKLARAGGARELLSITGTVVGYADGEHAIRRAGEMARAYSVPHLAVRLDPRDEALPDQWASSTDSWMSGARITLPLFCRIGSALRERLGEGYRALSGQSADTLCDNNYTSPSMGYWIRRVLFSSWFLRLMPMAATLAPAPTSRVGKTMVASVQGTLGARLAGMLASVLDGLRSRERFYGGRIFGYGEMPGFAEAQFPMLNEHGFEQVTDWYCANFVRPAIVDLDVTDFYRSMIELSMDMVMLHLDSRIVFHAMRMNGGRAQLPFMDARVVNFFGSIPYSARTFYRRPKDIIRSQAALKELLSEVPAERTLPAPREELSIEQVLARGSLGAYFRELLGGLTFIARARGLDELIDGRYVESQIAAFRSGKSECDLRLVCKLAALEQWSRALARQQRAGIA